MSPDRFPVHDPASVEQEGNPLDALRAKLAKAVEALGDGDRFAGDRKILQETQGRFEAWVAAARANNGGEFTGSIPVTAGEMASGEHLMYKPGELPQVVRDGKVLDELRQRGMEEIPSAKLSIIGAVHLLGELGIRDADVKAGQIQAIFEGRVGATETSFYRDNRHGLAEALRPDTKAVRLQTGIEGVSVAADKMEGVYTSSYSLLIDDGAIRKIQQGA